MRLLYRFLLVGLSVFVALLFIRKNNGVIIANKWAKWLTKRLGVRIITYGRIPQHSPLLYVSNHKSYIEGISILACTPVTFLGKEEVRHWPIIGQGAAAIGTVFVKRDDKGSRKNAAKGVKERLLEGKSVLVFPEGTTFAGKTVQKFFPGSFYVAAETGISIVPVAVRFQDDSDSFVDELFITNFRRVFSKKEIVIELYFGPRMANTDAHQLCNDAHQWIQDTLDKSGKL
jgi:1-acyl-sn-glycerol-3-phosphate acyltransferase